MSAIIGFTLTAIVFFYLGWKAKAKMESTDFSIKGLMKKVKQNKNRKDD